MDVVHGAIPQFLDIILCLKTKLNLELVHEDVFQNIFSFTNS